MKLARIVIPKYDNERRALDLEHAQAKHDMLMKWGGYTALVVAQGGWRDGDKDIVEPVIVYEIAMPRADVSVFRDWAREIARFCRQKSVMIVTPNGDVEFVHP